MVLINYSWGNQWEWSKEELFRKSIIMPYLAATLGGTTGKINVIGEKEVESKLRIRIHKNSPAFFVIFKSHGTAKENTDYFFYYLKQQ